MDVQISIDRLGEEGKKLRGHTPVQHLQPVIENEDTLADRVIRRLLRVCLSTMSHHRVAHQPNVTPMKLDKEFNSNGPFCLSWDEVSELCICTLAIIKAETMVLRLRAPIKGENRFSLICRLSCILNSTYF